MQKIELEYKDMESDVLKEALLHGMTVSIVASMVAKEMDLSKSMQEKLALAGIVHDIGKLKIRSYLVEKGESTMRIDEMRYTRTHPTFGFAVLTQQAFDSEICQAILYHHENFDGTGYPANLAGERIPMMSRVLRVCDVFAALISKRSYREAYDIDTAIALMIDEVRHFDMKVFLAFQRIVLSQELKDALGNLNSMDWSQIDQIL